MVVLITIRFRLTPSSPECRLPIIIPRIAMDTSKGEDIWYCVRHHLVIVEIVAMLDKLEAVSTWSFMVREQDSAGANKRTLAHETSMIKHRMPRLADRTIEVDVYCLSHNTNHVQDDIIVDAEVGGLSLLNFMFLSARLFRVIDRLCDFMRVVKYTEAPMGQKSISKLLVSMYLEGATCIGKALAELKELLDEICNLLNGCWSVIC